MNLSDLMWYVSINGGTSVKHPLRCGVYQPTIPGDRDLPVFDMESCVNERTAKKYHEHLRRIALGKITDEIKLKNKKNLRKERKYERRKAHVKDETESRAFAKLSKEHMSSDDDDTDTDEGEGGWVSRPPKYRSKTLEAFLNKELEDEETTDESRVEEREGEESDNDSSSGSDCDFENE
ncbi:uncharacterized protein [Pocillopora verrucosa]|uniref:uncharacterized protein n=1 Tax=Pocillopora verrucosa TaxID=203993 RepID=UPI00333FCE5D